MALSGTLILTDAEVAGLPRHFTGLAYPVGKVVWQDDYTGLDRDSLYLKALIRTHGVGQDVKVNIYGNGNYLGYLKGQLS
jgi:hypothetical protein